MRNLKNAYKIGIFQQFRGIKLKKYLFFLWNNLNKFEPVFKTYWDINISINSASILAELIFISKPKFSIRSPSTTSH